MVGVTCVSAWGSLLRHRQFKMAFSLVLALAVTLAGTAQAAAPGSLDTTFSRDGKRLVDFGRSDVARQVLVQRDGKLVVVGTRTKTATTTLREVRKLAITRLRPDGSLDPSFSSDGKVVTDVTADHDFLSGAALQVDGKIVVLGYRLKFGDDSDIEDSGYFLLRYRSDGSLDPGFGTAGKVHGDFGDYTTASDLVIQNGKIVVLGVKNDNALALARYHANGRLDTTFGNRGRVITRLGDDVYSGALAVQPDGRLVVATNAIVEQIYTVALVRYRHNGSLDRSFGTGGRALIKFDSTGEGVSVSDLLVQPDGRIAVAGGYGVAGEEFGDATFDFALLRFLPNGAPDTSFSGDGRVITNILGQTDFASAVALQPDGKLVLAGEAGNNPFQGDSFALARYTRGGALDTTLGKGGKVVANFGKRESHAYSVAMQGGGTTQQVDGRGKIVVAGGVIQTDRNGSSGGYDFAVARYNQ